MAGQTINDRLLAARHSLAGQGLAKSVCKATTEEMIGPKKKHLDYLVHCTNEPNVSIPQLANLLVERTQNANWVVVYKSLITVHHLLAYGNERFMQYLASSNSTFNLSNFLDKGGVQGAVGARIGYDMSPFIRRYAKYLNEKALSYRTVAFDFCKVKRGKEEGSLRTMNADKLLKTLPVLQAHLDALLEFDCTANDLTNGVINMCFMLLFRDLIRLFACYNDGIINLLEKYFDMNKKQCRDALDLYKKFLVRMDRVGEFLKVAENVGIDKGDIPDLTKAPSSLLDALEQHLASQEGKKGSAANTPTQTASSSFGTAAASTRFDTHTNGIDDEIKAQALAEEEAAMNKYKTKISSPTNGALTNPFLSSPPSTHSSAPIVDLFGSPTGQTGTDSSSNMTNTKASDDLLQLGNPFADMFGGSGPAPQPTAAAGMQNNSWMSSNGFNGTSQSAVPPPSSNTFVSETNFSTVFGNSESVENNINMGRYYYLQAANMDDNLPNPFLNDQPELIPGDGFSQEHSGHEVHKAGPPMRPPPPHMGGHATASPAHGGFGVTGGTQKSAFDDLNDSILIAMGGVSSPAKTVVQSSSQQLTYAMQGGGSSAAAVAAAPATAMLPAQQTMFSSPARQQQNVAGFDALGDVLKPGPTAIHAGPQNQTNTGITSGPQSQPATAAAQQPGKVLTGDLDSSLASLAENLTINKSASAQVKTVQWNSPKNQAKPGSASWTPQPMAATTGAGYRPMAQGMTVAPAPSTIHSPVHAPFSGMPAFFQQGMPVRPMMGGAPMMTNPGGMQMGGVQQQSMTGGMMSQTISGQQPAIIPQQTTQSNNNVQLDPFGAF